MKRKQLHFIHRLFIVRFGEAMIYLKLKAIIKDNAVTVFRAARTDNQGDTVTSHHVPLPLARVCLYLVDEINDENACLVLKFGNQYE